MPCYVWSDLYGDPQLVGIAVLDTGGAAGEFQYAPSYMKDGSWHAIDPLNLPFAPGFKLTRANKGIFGVLSDAGPDGWGRKLLLRMHPKRMATATRLDELELSSGHGVGALLFSQSRSAVKPRDSGIAMEKLGAAAEAAYQVEIGEVLRHQLELLMRGGGTGGFHPKVTVLHDGVLWIAKFRSVADELVDTPRLEWASMRLARECGIDAAEVHLKAMAERSAVMVRRFDRIDGRPLHYASVMSLWNRANLNPSDYAGSYSYAGIVELIQKLPGCDAKSGGRELFRRMVFNILIGNTDDHDRNHGFLMTPQGRWSLAPAFDVLPTVGGAQAVSQSIGVGPEGLTRSLNNALAASTRFGLNMTAANAVVSEMRTLVRKRFPELLEEAGLLNSERDAVMARMLS